MRGVVYRLSLQWVWDEKLGHFPKSSSWEHKKIVFLSSAHTCHTWRHAPRAWCSKQDARVHNTFSQRVSIFFFVLLGAFFLETCLWTWNKISPLCNIFICLLSSSIVFPILHVVLCFAELHKKTSKNCLVSRKQKVHDSRWKH